MTAARVPFTTAARSLLRETIIDAVAELARARGWSATTMADVARTAGVSRQTVYNEFGSRPALVEAYVTREIDALVGAVDATVRNNADDAQRALREAFTLFLQLASDEPVVQAIVGDVGVEDLQRTLIAVGRPLATERIGTLIPQVWPQAGLQDALMVADTLVRLAISHALSPSNRPEQVAADVVRMLAPFVEAMLGVEATPA